MTIESDILTERVLEHFAPNRQTLVDRTILITGATGGLGSALSRACALAGATVVLSGRNLQALESLYDDVEDISGVQPAIYPINQEGATQHDYYEMATTLDSEFGMLHGVVHCSGDAGVSTPVMSYPVEDWVRVMTVNLSSVFLITRAMLPLLEKSGNGSLLFTVDQRLSAFWGAYGVSKAGVDAFAQILADEVEGMKNDSGHPRVAVNRINPGAMRTQMRRKTFAGELPSESPDPEARTDAYLYLLARIDPALHGRLLDLRDEGSAT